MLSKIAQALQSLLTRRLRVEDQDSPPFHYSTLRSDPVDGITMSKLLRMLKDSRAGHADDLFALFSHIVSSDSTFIAGGLQRKSPLVAKSTTVAAPQKSDTQMLARRDILRGVWRDVKGKRFALAHLLDASLWPVSYVRKIWAPAPAGSGRFYDLKELRVIPFWQITFQEDRNGPAGMPKIKKLHPDGSWTGETELPDPLHFVCHRGNLLHANPDCWGGPMRAVVFWWYFGTWARTAAANHLEGHNQPKWVGKYPKVDALKAKRELLAAFNRATTTTALIIPEDAKLEAIQTLKSDSATAFQEFISLCQREIAKVVIAQTLTLEAQSQGLGSTQSNVQAAALDGVREFDAALLSETIQEQVFRSWLDLNGMAGGPVPELSWSADEDQAAVRAEMLNDLYLAGLEVKDEGLDVLSREVGLPMQRRPIAAALSAFSAGKLAGAGVPAVAIEARAAVDDLADAVAGDLAEAFGADFAAISRAIREASSASDLASRLAPAVSGFQPHRATRVIEETLAAAAANGFLCGHAAPR